MGNAMKKILSLVLCFCLLFVAPISTTAKTVTAVSSESIEEARKVMVGNYKVKGKRTGGTLKFTAQKDGTYTFKFSKFKCKTTKDAGTEISLDTYDNGYGIWICSPVQITNIEKVSASAKRELELKKNQTIYIEIKPSTTYVRDPKADEGYSTNLEVGGGYFLDKVFSFKLNIKTKRNK